MSYCPSFPFIADLLSVRLAVDINAIKPSTDLNSLGADSLTVTELIFDLEDKFAIQIGDERPSLVVVQDIADHIDKYLQQKLS